MSGWNDEYKNVCPYLSIDVTLSWPEMRLAGNVAVEREVDNLMNDRRHKYGMPEFEGWQRHMEGCFGECAGGRGLGRFWLGAVGQLDAADIGMTLEVRTTPYDYGRMPIHDSDKDHHAYILVTGKAPNLRLRGWHYARDGKHKKWFRTAPGKDGRQAYWVPQDALRDIFDLQRAKL